MAIFLLLAACSQSQPARDGAGSSPESVPSSAVGSKSVTSTIADPIARAPRVAAARMRREAARAAATAAGVLPDPMLDAQYMRMPRDPEYGSGGMVELGQTFPRWGERDGMRAMAAAEVVMADADLAMVRGETIARLAMYHAQVRAAEAKAAAYRENSKRAENLSDLIASSGVARLAEALTLRSRAHLLEISAQESQLAASDARGRARALLALPAASEVPDPGLLNVAQIDPARNPRLRLARAIALPPRLPWKYRSC